MNNRRQDDERLIDVDRRLTSHEDVCAVRYKDIGERLVRIEKILMGVAGTIICALVGALWTIPNK